MLVLRRRPRGTGSYPVLTEEGDDVNDRCEVDVEGSLSGRGEDSQKGVKGGKIKNLRAGERSGRLRESVRETTEEHRRRPFRRGEKVSHSYAPRIVCRTPTTLSFGLEELVTTGLSNRRRASVVTTDTVT